jgi:hypothetical protein
MHKAFLTFIAVLTFVIVAGLARWLLDKYPDKMRSGWRRVVGGLAIGILGLLAIIMLLGHWVHAHDYGQWENADPAIHEWYRTLMQPDHPTVSCCGAADAYFADEVHFRDGKTFAVITDDRPDEPLRRPHVDIGTEVEIPSYKLKFDRSNPTGHGIIFMRQDGYLFCYVQPGGV